MKKNNPKKKIALLLHIGAEDGRSKLGAIKSPFWYKSVTTGHER